MTNRNFSQIVWGPMTPDAPSVDEIRADLYGGQVAGRFAFRDAEGVTTASVTDGQETRRGDGTVTEDQMAEIRKSAGTRAEDRRDLPDPKSYVERRDPTTGVATRTYGDGRTEQV
jgi:hypothetical protein